MSTSSVDRAAGPSPQPIPQQIPDESRWPGLATPPHSPLRARAAEALFRRAVKSLDLRVRFPDGTTLGAGGPESPEMRIRRPAAFSTASARTRRSASARRTWWGTGPPTTCPAC